MPTRVITRGETMLVVQCKDHLEKVRAFADSIGLRDQLEGKLSYLNTYGGGEGREDYTRCILYWDFAPHSFFFNLLWTEEGKEPVLWFNGGLIYQGPDAPANGGAPSFTVSLAEGHGWFVHT